MEALEGRRLLTGTLTPSLDTQPGAAAVTVTTTVQPIGVTLDAVARVSFTTVVGKVKGLSSTLLKTLKGLTAYEHICQAWTKQPD